MYVQFLRQFSDAGLMRRPPHQPLLHDTMQHSYVRLGAKHMG